MKRKERRIEDRYKPVRAPNRKKEKGSKNLKVYTNEKKARRD